MSLFGALVRTTINVVTLPVAVAKDAICVLADAADGKDPGTRTAKKIQQIKDEADAD
jgi:hypothetical protein